KAYNVGIVHGDLSEYNIIVTREENCYVFDWPQWVDVHHPSALMLLRRDIVNITKFFRRKYRVKVDLNEVFQYFNIPT
ncbi:MAG: serine/threonine protein kinase, partial [Thermoprotei archaeon]